MEQQDGPLSRRGRGLAASVGCHWARVEFSPVSNHPGGDSAHGHLRHQEVHGIYLQEGTPSDAQGHKQRDQAVHCKSRQDHKGRQEAIGQSAQAVPDPAPQSPPPMRLRPVVAMLRPDAPSGLSREDAIALIREVQIAKDGSNVSRAELRPN